MASRRKIAKATAATVTAATNSLFSTSAAIAEF